MIEVFGWIVRHGKLFHHTAGARVAWNGEGDECCKTEGFESVVHNSTGPLSRQSPAPVRRCEAPSDFNARCEGGLEGGNEEADEADEFCCLLEFGRPWSEAVLLEVRFGAGDQLAAFFAGEWSGKVLHHEWVAIDHGEGFVVGGLPAAQEQAIRLESGERGHWFKIKAVHLGSCFPGSENPDPGHPYSWKWKQCNSRRSFVLSQV